MTDLDRILKQLRAKLDEGVTPRLVFDLDSTLFCVSPRTQFILRQFPSSQRAIPYLDDHAEAMKIIPQIETRKEDWGIRSALIRHDIQGRIDFFEAIRKHWADMFFANEYLIHDIAYPGAIEFVLACKKLGAEIRYLTGRDLPRMGDGTKKQLQSFGLPIDQADFLQLKSDPKHWDNDYKSSYFDQFSSELKQTWFFDNEPSLLHAVAERHPELNIVYTNTVHSGRAEPDPAWPKIGFEWAFDQRD